MKRAVVAAGKAKESSAAARLLNSSMTDVGCDAGAWRTLAYLDVIDIEIDVIARRLVVSECLCNSATGSDELSRSGKSPTIVVNTAFESGRTALDEDAFGMVRYGLRDYCRGGG